MKTAYIFDSTEIINLANTRKAVYSSKSYCTVVASKEQESLAFFISLHSAIEDEDNTTWVILHHSVHKTPALVMARKLDFDNPTIVGSVGYWICPLSNGQACIATYDGANWNSGIIQNALPNTVLAYIKSLKD